MTGHDGLQVWDNERGWVDVDEYLSDPSPYAALFTAAAQVPLRVESARVVSWTVRLTRRERIRRWLNAWRKGALGRLTGLHSPSAHMVGDCWCQAGAGRQTSAESVDDGSAYVVQEKTNPTDAASADSDSPSL